MEVGPETDRGGEGAKKRWKPDAEFAADLRKSIDKFQHHLDLTSVTGGIGTVRLGAGPEPAAPAPAPRGRMPSMYGRP